LLGDDASNELAVDIDFVHHRIAFSKPANQVKPDGAMQHPLIRVEETPLVPLSIEGAPPAQFELGTSKRLAAGTGGFIPETVATLNRAEFAGLTFGSMQAAFIPSSQSGTKSDVIAGDLGLPVLARFRLILDYSHNRVYALPYANAAQARRGI
jgi:hypothetical protein